MNYATLTERIQDTLETTFTADQLSTFTRLAEKAIFNYVDVPTERKSSVGSLSAGSRLLALPSDFIFADSLSFDNGSGVNTFLIQKDYNFMREAYPNDSVTGAPKYYGLLNDTQAVVGPVPDQNYSVDLTYGYYPESIATAGTTWLGDNFEEVLFNAAVVEAARFNKLEQDVIANYSELYSLSLQVMKNTLEGKRATDVYRSGQTKMKTT